MKNYIDWWKYVVTEKYINFSGRASLNEYWGFYIANISLVLMLQIMVYFFKGLFLTVSIVFGFFTLLPNLGVSARRLHDTGRSAWYLLLGFVPFIGFILLLYYFLQPGDTNKNEYGDVPNKEI